MAAFSIPEKDEAGISMSKEEGLRAKRVVFRQIESDQFPLRSLTPWIMGNLSGFLPHMRRMWEMTQSP